MSLRWSHYRQAARQQQLSHQQLQALLDSQAAATDLESSAGYPAQPTRTALASARGRPFHAWLQRRHQHKLAKRC